MSGTAWFQKKPKIVAQEPGENPLSNRMEGLWEKCDECGDIMLAEELQKALNVCQSCGHHMQLPARDRLNMLCDPDSFEEFDTNLEPTDPLQFNDSKKYKDRIKSTMKALGEKGRVHQRRGHHRRPPGEHRHLQLRIHGRLDGQRGRREGHPRLRAGLRAEVPGDRVLCFRRGAHAGRHLFADADGEDLGGDQPLPQHSPALHLGVAAPDHRWRRGLVLVAR